MARKVSKPTAADLREVASGRGSSRDKAEAALGRKRASKSRARPRGY